MIQARIARKFAPGKDSPGFALDIDFEAAAGITVLFGPSGAGKTLTLECIAGFVKPDSGRILLDDVILFDGAAQVDVPPRLRRCGYVFQNYALFPHMTLRENLIFAADRRARRERHRRVNEMLEHFHLAHVAGRRPHEVSGGEKQRCSIARALIGEPRLLLLDEPARGLDAPLRADLYALLRQVRVEFSAPILVVTHDLDEAFAIGDEMLVVQNGRVVQSGTPRQVLNQPASVDVARLLAIPNLFQAEITALDPGRNLSRLATAHFEISGPYLPGHFRGDRVWISARAEDLRVRAGGNGTGANLIPARLVRASERSQSVRLEFSNELFVDVSREEFERQKDNREWVVEFPPQALKII
jgi:molybdate transport system ATP-binding protein